MSRDKIKQMTSEKKEMDFLSISSFLRIRPWILVPNGSFMGLFDWVPENLRVGSWHPSASIVLSLIFLALCYFRPTEEYSSLSSSSDTNEIIMSDAMAYSYSVKVSSYPEVYSSYWWYNALLFLFQIGLLTFIMVLRTPGVIVTYTILSWLINGIRHGINTIAPFLHDGHILLHLNRVLRFPSLASASVTFCVWNFILLPFIYTIGLDTSEKRRNFTKFNLSFRLSQIHLCMIVYSIINTLLTGPTTVLETVESDGKTTNIHKLLFTYQDLWYGLMYGYIYGLFYSLILDRVGVHLYAVFSPRSKYVALTWICAQGLYIVVYFLWNAAIMSDILSIEPLLCLNGVFMITIGALYWKIFGLE